MYWAEIVSRTLIGLHCDIAQEHKRLAVIHLQKVKMFWSPFVNRLEQNRRALQGRHGVLMKLKVTRQAILAFDTAGPRFDHMALRHCSANGHLDESPGSETGVKETTGFNDAEFDGALMTMEMHCFPQ